MATRTKSHPLAGISLTAAITELNGLIDKAGKKFNATPERITSVKSAGDELLRSEGVNSLQMLESTIDDQFQDPDEEYITATQAAIETSQAVGYGDGEGGNLGMLLARLDEMAANDEGNDEAEAE